MYPDQIFESMEASLLDRTPLCSLLVAAHCSFVGLLRIEISAADSAVHEATALTLGPGKLGRFDLDAGEMYAT